jgi:HEAT repeat protein
MADSTLNKLVRLLGPGPDAELRRAGLLVAGAVGSAKERLLVNALLAALDDPDLPTRLTAIRALGELGAADALPRLVALVERGGEELESAAWAMGRMGKRGGAEVNRLLAESPPPLRKRLAAALGHGGSDAAMQGAVQALLDPDPAVSGAATATLAGELPSLRADQRKGLAERLLEILKDKKAARGRPAHAEAAIVRILSGLHIPDAEEIFWGHVGPAHPVPLRAAALQALGSAPVPASETKWKKLVECARDEDFRVVSPALMLLMKVPTQKKNQKHWQALLDAPDVAARRLAVDKLREVDSPEVAGALVPLLRAPDRDLRHEALAALQGTPSGREALVGALLDAERVEEAWFLARAQKPRGEELDSHRKALFTLACRFHEENDRRADALWFLLRQMDADQTAADILDKAQKLRKKEDHEGSLSYLGLLIRDPACGAAVRFEHAAVALKLSGKDPSQTARAADRCLGWFARLLDDSDFDLLGAVGKAKWLEPEDLFYLGFHFVEDPHKPAREFGRGVLELVVERSPRSAVARNARQKLKSAVVS